MNRLLIQACTQADERISAALGCPCPTKSRLSSRGTVSNPAALALGLDGERLASSIDLRQSWFHQVCIESGYLNFTLSPQWYQAALDELPSNLPQPPSFPRQTADFSAEIHPEDWHFWLALKGKAPTPAMAARQDRENPGWLVRYTTQRLMDLEPRAEKNIAWDAGQRQLMLTLVQYPQGERPRRLAAYLVGLARQIWELAPQRLSAELNRYCQWVLVTGRTELRAYPSAQWALSGLVKP